MKNYPAYRVKTNADMQAFFCLYYSKIPYLKVTYIIMVMKIFYCIGHTKILYMYNIEYFVWHIYKEILCEFNLLLLLFLISLCYLFIYQIIKNEIYILDKSENATPQLFAIHIQNYANQECNFKCILICKNCVMHNSKRFTDVDTSKDMKAT